MDGNKIVKYGIIGILALIVGRIAYNFIMFAFFGTLAVFMFCFVVLWCAKFC